MTASTLFACVGGNVVLPAVDAVLVDREDGGNLIVNPPRPVWERCELAPEELVDWSFLVAATGEAMLTTLPQLDGGCINYWEAGNWALNALAEPTGPKRAREHRQVHMHLLGRSPRARSPAWIFGEAPQFPRFSERRAWARGNRRLSPEECASVIAKVDVLLREKFRRTPASLVPFVRCERCAYPRPANAAHACEAS